MVKGKVMVLFNGTMGKNFKEIGDKVLNKGSEFGDLQKETAIKGNGTTTDNMVKESLGTKIAHTKANSKIFSNMEKDRKDF